MKKTLLFIQIVILLQFANPVCAQEAKNKIVLSGILAHYEQISKYGSAKVVPGITSIRSTRVLKFYI
jgi:hypothetical protein